jgi:hypothetical protein
LAFVIVFEIKVAITTNSAVSHAFERRDFNHRKLTGFLSVMSDKIVSR